MQLNSISRISPWKKPVGVIFLIGFLLLASGSSCDPSSSLSSLPPERPINAPHRPYEVVEFCPDYTVSTEYTREAVPAVADNIVAATTVNQDGVTIYVTPVTDDTLRNTLDPITIPALPADPQEPVDQAIPPQSPNEDPLAYQRKVGQIRKANQQAYSSWQGQLRANHQRRAEAIKKVQVAVQSSLLHLKVPTTPTTDLYSCYELASEHFQEHLGGRHVLLLDGDLVNTTDRNRTDQINLNGASVVVIWNYCQTAGECDSTKAYWQHYFLRHGARSVQFFDKASSEGMRDTHHYYFSY